MPGRAINRIASAIRSSLSLPKVLQTMVDEVGRATPEWRH